MDHSSAGHSERIENVLFQKDMVEFACESLGDLSQYGIAEVVVPKAAPKLDLAT